MSSSATSDGSSWSSVLGMPRILWFALLVSTFVYGGIIVSGFVDQGDDPSLRWVFFGIAIFGAVLSFAMPVFLRRGVPPLQAETRDEVVPDAQAMFRDAAPTQKVVVDPADVRKRYVARRMAPFLVTMALSEIPAIMGLLTWMSTDTPMSSCLVLVALGSVLMLVRFPVVNRWRADAEAQAGALVP